MNICQPAFQAWFIHTYLDDNNDEEPKVDDNACGDYSGTATNGKPRG